MIRCFSLATALVVTGLAQEAAAEPLVGVAYAGGTVSEGQSGYLGGLISLPGSTLGNGLAVRLGGGAGQYDYLAGSAKTVGKYVSADAAIVSQHSGEWGWANLAVGTRFSDTKLTPNDPANRLRGSRWDLALQTDGAFDKPDWRVGWYGSYGVFDHTYQAKLSAGRRIGASEVRLGVEAGVQGDPSYTRGFGGLFVSHEIARHTTLQISGGASEQAGRGPRAYGSLSLSKLF